jgi:putative ABC transport system permease protein
MAAIAWGFQASLERTNAARGADVIVTRLTKRRPSPTPFEQARANDLAAMPGVRAVAGMVWELLTIENTPSIVVYGWEPGSFLWDHLSPRAGQFKTTAEARGEAGGAAGEGGVYLGVMCAEVLRKKVGDTVQIESRTLRVAGIFESAAMIENGAAILPLPILQTILGSEGKVNFLNVRLAPNATAEQFEHLRDTIQARFRGLRVFRGDEIGQNTIETQAAKAMSVATLMIALVIGTLGVMNTMLMSVFERKCEIGLLMAVGWRYSRILAMILLESLMLCLFGAVAGVVLGVAGVRTLQNLDSLRDKIEAQFGLGLVSGALVFAVVLGILGGVYPALRALAVQPLEALRSE